MTWMPASTESSEEKSIFKTTLLQDVLLSLSCVCIYTDGPRRTERLLVLATSET